MVPPPKPFASCRGTALLATAKGPLSRVSDSSDAVMTLSAIQFDLEAVDVVVVEDALFVGALVNSALVAKVTVDCSLINSFSIEFTGCAATAATFTETISTPVTAISFR